MLTGIDQSMTAVKDQMYEFKEHVNERILELEVNLGDVVRKAQKDDRSQSAALPVLPINQVTTASVLGLLTRKVTGEANALKHDACSLVKQINPCASSQTEDECQFILPGLASRPCVAQYMASTYIPLDILSEDEKRGGTGVLYGSGSVEEDSVSSLSSDLTTPSRVSWLATSLHTY